MDFLPDTAFYPYRPSAWVRVSGADAASFLQGQFTNELRGLAGEGNCSNSVYGLWLNQKGKVLADSCVMKGKENDEFLVGSYFSEAATIRQRLEAYIIADDVVIEDVTAAWAAVSLLGPHVDEWLTKVPAGVVAFRGRRSREPNVEWIFPSERSVEVYSHCGSMGMRELSLPEVDSRRIAAGIPAVPQDIGPGELPNEGGLEASAISYTKGCYLGQEVIARLKSMGQVRRRLLRVEGTGESLPSLPAAVFIGERKVGELRSAAPAGTGNYLGLALLSLVHVRADSTLSLMQEGPPALRIDENP